MQNLHLKAEGLTGDTITFLEGKALEQKPPVKIELSGDIKTVATFLKVRKIEIGYDLQEVNKSKALVLVDKKDLTIELQLDPQNCYGTIIQGVLTEAEELKQFGINTTNTFKKEQLVKLLKFNKIWFDDHAKHAQLVLAFQKVESTVNIRANESNDERGNKERAFVKEVTTNAPTEFILNIPIFNGFAHVRFRVEICLDVTEGSARFWFESVELHEIKQILKEKIFAEELKAAEGFVIIYI
jgi:hypothetical protein